MNLYEKVDQYIVENSSRWIEQGKTLQTMPEYGFCEKKTSAFVLDTLERLGIGPVRNMAVTGRMATMPGRDHKANVGFIAELDGIYSPKNPSADPETGVSHACGHNIHVNALLAVADALKSTGAMEELDGDVTLIAVPAEENTPTHILDALKAEGKIETDCGKHEMLRLGLFDPIDIVIGAHALVNYPGIPDQVMVNSSCHGLTVTRFTFHGIAAHSTVCPEKGVNALNAAVLTINSIQAMREHFDPEESIRVSYNITDGGTSIGSIVDRAVLEVVIAAKSVDALDTINSRIKDAAGHCAAALQCGLDIRDISRLAPYQVDPNLLSLIKRGASIITGEETRTRPHNYFSNDLGDVSQILPTAQIVYGGFLGDLHSADFHVTDEVNAYVLPARVTAHVILSLLSDGCEKARFIRDQFKK